MYHMEMLVLFILVIILRYGLDRSMYYCTLYILLFANNLLAAVSYLPLFFFTDLSVLLPFLPFPPLPPLLPPLPPFNHLCRPTTTGRGTFLLPLNSPTPSPNGSSAPTSS